MPTIYIPSCRHPDGGNKMPATYMRAYHMSAPQMSTYEMQATTCQQQNGGNNVQPITCQQLHVGIIRYCILGSVDGRRPLRFFDKTFCEGRRPLGASQ